MGNRSYIHKGRVGQGRWRTENEWGNFVRWLDILLEDIDNNLVVETDLAIKEVSKEAISSAKQMMGMSFNEFQSAALEMDIVNRTHFRQENPANAFDDPAMFKADEEVVTYKNQHKTRGGVHSRKLSYKLISTDVLDKVDDRTEAEMFKINVVVPFIQQSKGSDYSQNLGYLIPLTIRGRGMRGSKWRLWRAIEYGGIVGSYGRVWVRSVTAHVPIGDESSKSMERTAKGWIPTDIDGLQFGEWAVFMSNKWQWWERQIIPGLDNIRVDPPGATYQAGTHPIYVAVTKTMDTKLKEAIRSAIDKAVRDAFAKASARR